MLSQPESMAQAVNSAHKAIMVLFKSAPFMLDSYAGSAAAAPLPEI